MQEENSYLDILQFNEKFKESFVYKYITNIRFVVLLIISIVLLGVASYVSLPRRLNPEVKIPVVSVSTIYPGASPQDVETLVTIPIEDELNDIDGLDVISSVSQENVSIVTLEFVSSINGEDAEQDVITLVEKINLPEDVLDPRVELFDFENQAIWRFALYADDSSTLNNLFNYAQRLKDNIESTDGVDRVTTAGLPEKELIIEFDVQSMKDFGINANDLRAQLSSKLNSLPAGSAYSTKLTIPLSVEAISDNVEKIRNVRLTNSSGKTVRLGDIALVYIGSEVNTETSFLLVNGEPRPAIVFAVYKNLNADILKTTEAVQAEVERSTDPVRPYVDYKSLEDSAKSINEEFEGLVSNFASTILLVFITLFLFLGLKQALIVSTSIPLTFLISFISMSILGISINFLSLFSLLLALGLLVDDAIVIVSAMTSYYKTGKFSGKETGALVWQDFIIPIWSTTITTVWAFVPLLLATGIIGEFIKSIPIVVSSTLLGSTTVAVLITLPLMIVFLEPKIALRVKRLFKFLFGIILLITLTQILPKSSILIPTLFVTLLAISLIIKLMLPKLKSGFESISKYTNGIIDISQVENRYKLTIQSIITSSAKINTTIILVVMFSLFSYTLVPLGLVKNEFFPKTDEGIIYINGELPSGTQKEITKEEIKEILKELSQISELETVTGEIGTKFTDSFAGAAGDSDFQISIKLKDIEQRDRSSQQISEQIRDMYKDYDKGKISVLELSGGPPAGSDIQVKFKGDSLSVLQDLASQTQTKFDSLESITNTSKSISGGASKISFRPNEEKLSENGITSFQISDAIRTQSSGQDLGDIRINGDVIDIKLYVKNSKFYLSELNTLTVFSQKENIDIPVTELGKFVLEPNPTQITRENGERTISVSAGIKDGYVLSDVVNETESYLDNDLSLPSGYTWESGGVNQENEESVRSILLAMLLSAILILVTMVLQLGSFRKAFIVLMVIPLAVSGVFVLFALTGTALSFPALIGVLALFGIVVNNSIVIVEKINQNLKVGMNSYDAISDASAGRLQPILFSSLTTIMGLLPITLSDPLWQGLGGAIISGLAFSGMIMLLFIPVVYAKIYSND